MIHTPNIAPFNYRYDITRKSELWEICVFNIKGTVLYMRLWLSYTVLTIHNSLMTVLLSK